LINKGLLLLIFFTIPLMLDRPGPLNRSLDLQMATSQFELAKQAANGGGLLSLCAANFQS
jgi:hypothetical protein